MTIPKSQGAWRMKEKKDPKSPHEISIVWRLLRPTRPEQGQHQLTDQ